MSKRMDATLFSEEVRLERGDSLTFRCELLSQLERDVQRNFFGAYFPRWHAFYLEEVRDIVGNLGYTVQRHFPVYPFEVYLREDGSHFMTDDFYVGRVLTLPGLPSANLRDDEQRKSYKIVSVDDTQLRTHTGAGLPCIRNSCRVPVQLGNSSANDGNGNVFTLPRGGGGGGGDSNGAMASTSMPASAMQTSTGKSVQIDLSAMPEAAEIPDEIVSLLNALRDSYIDHAGGGIPELGIKAMGRPFRLVSKDGRRWMTRGSMIELIRGAHGKFAEMSAEETEYLGDALYRAFMDFKDADGKHWSTLRADRAGGATQDGSSSSRNIDNTTTTTNGQLQGTMLSQSSKGGKYIGVGQGHATMMNSTGFAATGSASSQQRHSYLGETSDAANTQSRTTVQRENNVAHKNAYNNAALLTSMDARQVGKRLSELNGPFVARENPRAQRDMVSQQYSGKFSYLYEPTNDSTQKLTGTFRSAVDRAEGMPWRRPLDEEGESEYKVDYDMFINFVRGPMSEQRKRAVKDLFAKMDHDRNGYITLRELRARFNATNHPVVRDGTFTSSRLADGFMSMWDEASNSHANHKAVSVREMHTAPYGTVSFPEFVDYCNGLSAAVEKDDVFVDMLRNTWTV